MDRMKPRIACAAFARARAVVGDAIRALKANHRGLDFKNPINEDWIKNELNVNHRFVVTWGQVDVMGGDFSDHLKGVCGVKRKLSDEHVAFVESHTRKRKHSARKISKLLEIRHHVQASRMTITRTMKNLDLKPFKLIRRSLITPLNEGHRLDLVEFCEDWDEKDYLNLAPSDEFFVYAIRRHNAQNDRVWARTREEVADILVAPNTKHCVCIGIFLVFTTKGLAWNIKAEGQSWDGEYFRETILPNCVMPFLRNRNNRQGRLRDVWFLHDLAGCFNSHATQDMMEDLKLNCFKGSGFGRWPGNSPDLNPAENIGAIMKDRVEDVLIVASEAEQSSRDFLIATIEDVLEDMKRDRRMFRNLVMSFPTRLDLVKESNGKAIPKY